MKLSGIGIMALLQYFNIANPVYHGEGSVSCSGNYQDVKRPRSVSGY